MGPVIVYQAIMFLVVTTASTATACDQTFGDNCEYQCHCASVVTCGTDGSCSNGCANGWEGEYCQRGNVAAGRSSSTSQSATNGSYSAALALNGNTNQAFSSCSHTTNQNQPWWKVDLGKVYVLFTVKIWNTKISKSDGDVRECKTTEKGTDYKGTMNTTRKGFTCADWLDETVHSHNYKPTNSINYCRNPSPDDDDEPWCYTTNKETRFDHCNVPWCQSKLKNFEIRMDDNHCYKYNGSVNFVATPEYHRCDTPVVGRNLTIQLLDSSTVLTLCEVTVQAFQYRACQTKHYGPNCNNRCQCANDDKCDDKTGGCPNGKCNDSFTGPYCNIEIPTISMNAPSTPTSIRIKWVYNRPHDSTYDAGKVETFELVYNSTPDSSSGYLVTSPNPGLLTADLTALKPSTQYSVSIRLIYSTSKTGSINSPFGPMANFQTESCAAYMVMPVITVISNRTVTGSAWPNRVSLVITAEVPNMIAACNKQLNVYIKKTTESSYVELTKTGQTYTMDGLTAFTDYDIKATVSSPDGKQKDNIQTIQTAEDVPSEPTIAEAGASPNSVSIKITPPDPPYGVITKYSLTMWEAGSSGKTYSFGPTNLTHTFSELDYYTTYHFQAQASTSVGFGAWSNEINITTVERIPGPPNSLLAKEHTTNSLVLVWTKPKYPNGILKNYKMICTPLFSYDDDVNAKRTNYVKESSPGPNVTQLQVTDLTPATEYNCSVAAQTSMGYGPSVWLTNWTKPEVPGPPNTLLAEEHTTNSLDLEWTKPKNPNGNLTNYKVICTPLFSYNEDVNRNRTSYAKVSNSDPDTKRLKVTGLTPATEYNCSVAAQTSKGYGPSVWLRNWTKPEEAVVPENLFPSVSSSKTTDSTITVEVSKMPKSLKTGSINNIRIAVEKQQKRRRRSTSLRKEEHDQLTDYEAAKKKGYPGYIAAELAANFSGPFVIGDGKTYGGYKNPPLTKGQKYDVIFGMVFTVGGQTTIAYRRYGNPITVGSVESSVNVVGLAAGVTVGVLVVLAVIIIPVVIIMRKKRGEKEEATESLPTQLHDITSPIIMPEFEQYEVPATKYRVSESTVPIVPPGAGKGCSNLQGRTIKLPDLTPYVKSIRGERAKEFKNEFDELPVNAVKSIKDAEKLENSALNRYKNIATYDHSRVVLQPVGEEISDYINASYIHGYDKEKAYIASQGPLPDSVTATWRMIWQERCDTIIMLTKLEEMGKKKCEQYWPSQGRKTYGPFTVQLAEEYKFTDYVKLILKVTLKGEVHTVKFFHFTAWPDHGVPKFACSLLNFRANVLKETEYGKAPILVHCSAGVGRTGTFIAIDYLIRQGKAEKKVNFYECVRKMREQRPNMVQNLGQYTHIHDAILEFFKIGITNIQSANFPKKYSDMIKMIPGRQTCQLQNQYSILDAFTDAISPSEPALANMSRNRKQGIVPDDQSRVVLTSLIDGWDDYVNAVYATGYGERDIYIITQMPLPETMKDIWRIVHDTGISTIVMMNVVDDTYEFSTVYWPQEGERVEYGPLVVEGLDEDTSNSDITARDLRLSKMADKGGKDGMSGRMVRHFQLQNWPDSQATPSSPESIVELLEMVEKWQQKVENKTILVQCLDGASQSGVFCAAHSVIEKVKVDHEVDVFQYLRLLRSNRPQLVNTYEQYKFIHEVVLKYLQGFDTYDNFQ
ncbi:receptor-type tyrosine-protein phosphatase T-like [Lineus longissimus]|uniref:receptor-type tyrosine-protein phosphatase T-like n=1 Tax=Lineus longissimus TaxID=88925 RepID=UPI00315CDADF